MSASIQDYSMPVHYPEVVLSIGVYHNVRKRMKIRELLVLRQQTLTELRDKICCSTDNAMQKAGQHDPSGHFLIEDTFCNDLRDPFAVDYSEPVLCWLRNSNDEAFRKWKCLVTGMSQKNCKRCHEL